MKREIVKQAKTVEEAIALGAAELGVDAAAVAHEVLEQPKKGLFGIGSVPAKVRITYVESPDEVALSFVKTLIADMELDVSVSMTDLTGGDKLISVTGERAGILIGHHGDTLDAIQYLANLAANRKEDEDRQYTKITVDVENYRSKREETLCKLANRMSEKVLKYQKSITLEPMNPYERRIIHSAVQNIEGVSTNSIGAENNRRIVIFPTGADGKGTLEDARNAEKKAAAQKKAQRSEDGERSRGNKEHGGRGGRGRGRDRGARAEKYEPVIDPNRPQRVVDRAEEEAAAELNAEIFERAAIEKEREAKENPPTPPSTPRSKKPYYMRPKNAPAAQRPYQKPVKKDSVESYYFDLENSKNGLSREKEEPSDIAKACGIYEDDTVNDTANE